MRDRGEFRSFGLVLVLIAIVCATAFISCGSGGGGGGNDGTICDQCGDSDGLCVETREVTGDDRPPSFCVAPNPVRSPCMVELRCVRKLDSSQRRCFPADPVTHALDLAYRCDGSRPDASAPTATATPTTTATPTATLTPTLTPSATAETPTPALSLSPTPEATAEDVDVTINIETSAAELPANFSGTVTYPTAKGSFLSGGELDCSLDDEATPQDNGNGTLTISYAIDPADFTSDVSASCTFHQVAGQTLANADLGPSVTPNTLTITIDDL